MHAWSLATRAQPPNAHAAQFEIDTVTQWNPIKQDKSKDGSPRDYKLDSLTNYGGCRGPRQGSASRRPSHSTSRPASRPRAGALTQTYEDPAHKDTWTGLLGDGDPVDVCEIGSRLARTGDAYQVKVRAG